MGLGVLGLNLLWFGLMLRALGNRLNGQVLETEDQDTAEVKVKKRKGQ